MLERAVYYEKLAPQSLDELAKYARELGQQALIEINQRAFELAERDANEPHASHRMTFGIYFFSASDNLDQAGDEGDATSG
jgi:hypothetical protein